ncbi:MAG TPA: hypothetical protein VLA91_07380 [Acidimicrobiia bacterium]|nr:hypothetical protein [Acidimicrobiia bacterium]
MESPVVVSGLTRTFRVPVRATGLRESIRSLFNRQFQDVEAMRGVNFELPRRLPRHLAMGIKNYSGASA